MGEMVDMADMADMALEEYIYMESLRDDYVNSYSSGSHPICSVCNKSMNSRMGIYGLFYFCTCKGQNTISDKTWKLIKR